MEEFRQNRNSLLQQSMGGGCRNVNRKPTAVSRATPGVVTCLSASRGANLILLNRYRNVLSTSSQSDRRSILRLRFSASAGLELRRTYCLSLELVAMAARNACCSVGYKSPW